MKTILVDNGDSMVCINKDFPSRGFSASELFRYYLSFLKFL